MIVGKKETIWYVDVKNPTGEEEIEPEEQTITKNIYPIFVSILISIDNGIKW